MSDEIRSDEARAASDENFHRSSARQSAPKRFKRVTIFLARTTPFIFLSIFPVVSGAAPARSNGLIIAGNKSNRN